MSYDQWLEAPYQRAQEFAPGEEDLLGVRVFLPDEGDWATVQSAEQWEDADEDGRYGGVSFTLRTDGRDSRGRRWEVQMDMGELQELVDAQRGTPIRDYAPPEPG